MFKGMAIGLSEGLLVTVFSMAIVFIALLAISYSIDIMRIFVHKK